MPRIAPEFFSGAKKKARGVTEPGSLRSDRPRARRGEVDEVYRRRAVQKALEVRSHNVERAGLRLAGERADVGREDNIVQLFKSASSHGRLHVAHIQCGPAEVAAAQGLKQRRFIHDAAAGRVDE